MTEKANTQPDSRCVSGRKMRPNLKVPCLPLSLCESVGKSSILLLLSLNRFAECTCRLCAPRPRPQSPPTCLSASASSPRSTTRPSMGPTTPPCTMAKVRYWIHRCRTKLWLKNPSCPIYPILAKIFVTLRRIGRIQFCSLHPKQVPYATIIPFRNILMS